jgi:lectin family protein
MKVLEFRTRLFAPVAVICCFVCLGSQSLHAQQTISYPNFSSSDGIQLNGSTAVTSNGTAQVLRITPAALSQVGSAWYAATLPLSQGFTTTFKFQLTQPGGIGSADGFAFVVQNGSFANGTSGSLAVGAPATSGGGGIGYQGLTKSVAIEFDTFDNSPNSDVSSSEVAVQSCGTGANTAVHGACTSGSVVNLSSLDGPIFLADGQVHTAVITYTPPSIGCIEGPCSGTLAMTLDGQAVLTTAFNLASLGLDANRDAFVGFTAATGAGDENHDILSWSFTANQSAQTQTATLGGPGTTATLTFNADTYKITSVDNQGGEQLTVTAFQVPKSSFPSITGFSNETCVPYADYSSGAGVDTCVEFQATCVTTSGGICNFNYFLATSYDLPPDLPAIGGPDFIVAHGHPCALTTGSTVQSIFLSYTVARTDPTTRGGSLGPSCFVATYTPGAPVITSGGVSRSQFVGWGSPVVNNALNQVKAGSARPLPFQFFDNSGSAVTNLTLCTNVSGTGCTVPWVNLASFAVACSPGAPVNSATDTSTLLSSGGSGLQNNGGGNYQFNWKTQKGWQGCANVIVTFSSGLVVTPATLGFQFN